MTLSANEKLFLVALVDPCLRSGKDIAASLRIGYPTLKVKCSRMYDRLGWHGGSLRELTLWAIANRELLGAALPTPDQFPKAA